MNRKDHLPVILHTALSQLAVPLPQPVARLPPVGIRLYGADGADRQAATFWLVYAFRTAVGIHGVGIEIVYVDGVVGTLTHTDTTRNAVFRNPTRHDNSKSTI